MFRKVALYIGFVCVIAIASPLATTLGHEPGDAPSAMASDWRRTRDGWELRSSWYVGNTTWKPPAAATFHPALIGLLQLGTSVACLLGFERSAS